MSTTTKMAGAERIAAERQRQISQEGWTDRHDAGNDANELARAAVSYATPPERRVLHEVKSDRTGRSTSLVPQGWPWEGQFWKPTPDDRVRELEKAGALIAAEIDRLLATEDGTR